MVEIDIFDIGLMELEKDMVSFFILMIQNMKDFGKIMKKMDLEYLDLKMELNI